MDYSGFVRLLHEETAPEGEEARRHIIRFAAEADFRHCRQLLARKQAADAPDGLQLLPLIGGIGCRLRSTERFAAFGADIAIEQDGRVKVEAIAPPQTVSERAVPWGVREVKAPMVWNRTMGSRIRIGVIDTGADYSHPDLRSALARGINLIRGNAMPFDDNGHGTHIAGTIAAAGSQTGLVGVAPMAVLYPVKAFDHKGTAFVSDIIYGIDWCVQNRMHIINMSFGMRSRSKAFRDAVANAYNAGIVVVASSGNNSRRTTADYPARYAKAISVGATDANKRVAPFSNRSGRIDILAPGDKIRSTWLNGKYTELSGTSMATSHVSGVIALLLAARPGLSPLQVKQLLRKTASPVAGLKVTGNKTGLIDAYRLLYPRSGKAGDRETGR